MTLQPRHGRACPGHLHPHGACEDAIPVSKHPMKIAGSSPAMTGLAARAVRQHRGLLVLHLAAVQRSYGLRAADLLNHPVLVEPAPLRTALGSPASPVAVTDRPRTDKQSIQSPRHLIYQRQNNLTYELPQYRMGSTALTSVPMFPGIQSQDSPRNYAIASDFVSFAGHTHKMLSNFVGS